MFFKSLFISFINSPIKVPLFVPLVLSQFLCIPITCNKFISLLFNIIGHPDDPVFISILCPNSKPLNAIILPHAHVD